jgi:hypothetical protein
MVPRFTESKHWMSSSGEDESRLPLLLTSDLKYRHRGRSIKRLAQASHLAQATFNLMLLIRPVTPEDVDPIKLTWVGEADDLQSITSSTLVLRQWSGAFLQCRPANLPEVIIQTKTAFHNPALIEICRAYLIFPSLRGYWDD